ncbi:TetR/AcrR family transcriptional regulator [Flavobacterium sp. HXWNR69]|uniref:TetR/AcrR family transcriptional regulator n=1 Tax=Flavobacterium fragile TaxID=2949085 RepID=A0ABT0THL5_9FLAO|nr:TetR/AcrR family transcriptional regulator [Flavobacterium sp. HXWNR69]MCL9770342.1 TetR/AcrR family transcriptional regulator [Flavobacterium sp. HXWNR69]
MSKKQDILNAALKVFTELGTKAASTRTIALEANVSEALIFKHFKSKDNLIEEILKCGYRQATKLVAQHVSYKFPKEYISNLLDLPKILVLNNKDFWQMQYKITPLNSLAMMHHRHFMTSSHEMLTKAFSELGYSKPELEAEIVLMMIDALWKHIASNDLESDYIEELILRIKEKYHLLTN